jgi:hypothetical protein
MTGEGTGEKKKQILRGNEPDRFVSRMTDERKGADNLKVVPTSADDRKSRSLGARDDEI